MPTDASPLPGHAVVRLLRHPFALALIVTCANALKPAVVDDTAYLMFARQIADHPGDPYGFEMFWYSEPEPAMEVLAPPVVPYWLAAGIRLVGDNLFLLKVWLFPFILILTYASRDLLARFARGTECTLLPAIVLGPGILPFVNVMLDVPALAFEVAAVSLFIRAADDRGPSGKLILSGLCAGIACQTKYSVLAVPAVIAWYGILRRRVGAAAVSIALGVGLFAGWEFYLRSIYGRSHFEHHLIEEIVSAAGSEAASQSLAQKLLVGLGRKLGMINPVLGHLGATAWWIGCLGCWSLGAPARLVRGVTVGVGFIAVLLLFVPGQWAVISHDPSPATDRLTLNGVLFVSLGTISVMCGLAAAGVLLIRRRGRAGLIRRDHAAWFLAGWFVLEFLATLGMTPFPAGRRVLGITFALALLVARLWSRVRHLPGRPKSAGWIGRAAVATGFVFFAMDTLDAWPEKAIPARAAGVAKDRDWTGTGWYVGHWGFEYYCQRLGMRPLVHGRAELQPGDWVVVPVYPDPYEFYRPVDWPVGVRWDSPNVVAGVELVWDDWLSAQTVPNLYGGTIPVVCRKHPRLRVIVYRVVKSCRA